MAGGSVAPHGGRRCVVSVATVKPRYLVGMARLARELDRLKDATPRLFWRDGYPPDSPSQQQCPYGFKPFAILAAEAAGFEQVLWLDSMVVPMQPLDAAFKIVEAKGWLLADNPPWTVGDHCTDAALVKLQLTRNESLQIPSISAATLGVNLVHPTAREFLRQWRDRADEGTFHGPRRTHRHDQTAASVIAHRLGMDGWIRLGYEWEYRRSRATGAMLFLLDRRL